MRSLRVVACAVITTAFCVGSAAQSAPTGYHVVNCIKIKPDKGAEFHKWVGEGLTKYAHSRVDSGAVSTWYLLRAVYPVGAEAGCDYLSVAIFPGAPPEPLSPAQLGEVLKKAGIAMTAEEYAARREGVSTLESTTMYRMIDSTGSFADKGNYLSVALMKTGNVDEWLELERKVWKPIAEQMVKDGVQAGWSVNLRAFGLESDLPFQGVTVDVFANWDAVWKEDSQFIDRLKKVHPEMDPTAIFERITKARTMVRQELYAVEEKYGK